MVTANGTASEPNRWTAWEALADLIRLDGDPEEIHGPAVRTALVDWATRRGPDTTAPPSVVVDHLDRHFAEAEKAGKRQGIARGLLFCTVLVLLLIMIALLLPTGTP